MNNVKFFNNHENTPLTPLSIGELVDKITILEIKEKNIKDTNKLVNVQTELKTLRIILNKLNVKNKISAEILKLKKTI